MKVLRFADLSPTPWKNGGGTTREYLVHPPGAGTGDFYWRVSRARVEKHGAFSLFPGIDRTLTVVAGDTIDLIFADRRVRLDRTTPPYAFRGDDVVECRIPAGAIEDLNVMTRRGHWAHRVERRRLEGTTDLELGGDHALVFTLDGLRVRPDGGGAVDLEPGDALDLERPSRLTVEPTARTAEILVVRLDHVVRDRI